MTIACFQNLFDVSSIISRITVIDKRILDDDLLDHISLIIKSHKLDFRAKHKPIRIV